MSRGKCEGDCVKVWIGTGKPYRAAMGRQVTFYPTEECTCLFTVHSIPEFQRLFGVNSILPDTCIELKNFSTKPLIAGRH